MKGSTPGTADSCESAANDAFLAIVDLMFVEESAGQLFAAEATESGQFAHSLLYSQIP